MFRFIKDSKRAGFLGIILIALGIIFTTTMEDNMKTFGIVFIALGGFYLIVGLSRRK
jgi:drug/metabolite transporter superfamily protein YnfA